MNRKAAKATEGCNRCQYANVDFVNAANPTDCSSYYYCYSDGQPGGVVTCKTVGTYFNEGDQGCAFNPDVKTYASSNGACYAATSAATGSTASTGSTTDSTGPTESGPTDAPAEDTTEATTTTTE